MKHPSEAELALLAGGDCNMMSRFFLNRHVRQCAECTQTVAEYVALREDLAEAQLAGLNWDALSEEMTANIHLGLEAGECVRRTAPDRIWNPRLAVALASLLFLLGAGVALRAPQPSSPLAQRNAAQEAAEPVLESTGSGLELRTGGNSLTLMNHHGTVAGQTVSTQGEIRASYVEAGAVTFNAVYLE